MALSDKQQVFERLKQARNILIAIPQEINADNLASSLVLLELFKKQNKKAEIISSKKIPAKYLFLPKNNLVKNNFEAIRDFIISINTEQNKISRIKYEQEKNNLKIFLTSPDKIEEKNISLKPGTFKYDLILTVGAQDLESLGDIFEKNSELFFEKPILNIDDQSSNENFGEINLVDPTASSCAEILLTLFEEQNISVQDEETATLLLAGIIEKTESFQNFKTTPKALTLASLLINAGAKREEVVKNLYKTKPLALLRLWGRILSKINFNEEKNIIFGEISSDDFIKTNSSSALLPMVMNEIYESFPLLNAAYLLWQDGNDQIKGILFSPKNVVYSKIEESFNTAKKNNFLIFSDKHIKPEKINSLIEPLL